MEARDRLQYVTANFTSLQGLRLVVLIVPVMLYALLVRVEPPPESLEWLLNGWLRGALMVGAYLVVEYYYMRRFGVVFAVTRPNRVVLAGLVLLGLLVIVGLQLAGPLGALPIGFASLLLATVGLTLFWGGSPWRRHWLVIVSAVLLLGLVSLIGGPLDAVLRAGANLGYYVSFALLIIVGALLDHRLLVQTIRPAHRNTHGAAV